MTSEDEAFLAAICHNPADDLPRLVYADYLEEHDQPERARFIRLQCELAQMTEKHPDWNGLILDEIELRERFEPKWCIPGLRGVQHFNRGFVEVIQTSAEWLLNCDSSLFRHVPLRELRLVTMDRFVNEITQLEVLDRVEILTLNNNSLGFGGLEQLLQTRPLDRLQRLELRNCMIWPDAIATLVNSRQAVHLQTIDLSGNPVGDLGIEHLAQSNMPNLRGLIIRGDEMDQRDCLHSRAAEIFSDSQSRIKELRYLDWGDQYIGDEGLLHLGASLNFQHLEKLRVPFNEIGVSNTRSVAQFLSSAKMPKLELLDLSGNTLSQDAAQAMLRWPGLARGAVMELFDCELEFSEPEHVSLEQLFEEVTFR
jgi:uncharacterized protein (TIGR02996 family)